MKYSYKSINELGKVITGKTPRTENSEYFNGLYPFITPTDIHSFNEKYLSTTERTLSDLGALQLKSNLLPKDSICFVCIGSTIGKMCKTKCDSFTNQQINSIIPYDDYNSDYLFYYMRYIKDYFISIGGGTGSGKGIINKTVFSKTKVKIVNDFDFQNKIAIILSKYDELIDINNKRIKLLEQAAEELYKEWFVRFRFPNYQSAEFENEKPNGWHFGDESNMKRPKGWEYTKFKKLGLFKRGKNITASEMVEGNIPVISAGIEPSGYHNKPNVYGDSLTISASGANAGFLKYNLKNIWAADCLYYQDDELLWYVYNTLKFLQPVISNMQCGAAQPHVYPKNISKLCIIIPPKSLIKKFCNTVTPFYNEIKQLNQKNEILVNQRDLLLPRLMSGKLEVK